jgi:N4-gp56 family major capsid protein
MGIQTYDAPTPGRLGKFAGEILNHAIPTEVLRKPVTQYDIPKNKSDTLVVRSWVPYGATVAAPNTWTVTAESHITQEGVTPDADTIVARDVNLTLNQYMCLYALTDRDYDLYEDDVAEAMKEQVGERMGLVAEMAVYGKMKAGTNKFFAGGGSNRASVNSAITSNLCSKVVRSLEANHAKKINSWLSPSPNVGTSSVEKGFVWFTHTDSEFDIRQLPGFTPTADYGQRSIMCEEELGSYQKMRFVLSAELYPYLNAGAAVGATGLKAQSNNVDVYPNIVLAKDAFAQLKLRGSSVLSPIWLPPGMMDKSDPGGQRGYVGAKFYHACEITNQGWMAVVEAGVNALP